MPFSATVMAATTASFINAMRPAGGAASNDSCAALPTLDAGPGTTAPYSAHVPVDSFLAAAPHGGIDQDQRRLGGRHGCAERGRPAPALPIFGAVFAAEHTPGSFSDPSADADRTLTFAEAAAQAVALVDSVRRRALAMQAGLDELAANEATALARLDSNRDAALVALHGDMLPGVDPAEVMAAYASGVDTVRAAVATKRVGLETEALAADEVLVEALDTSAALTEVYCGRVRISDAFSSS